MEGVKVADFFGLLRASTHCFSIDENGESKHHECEHNRKLLTHGVVFCTA
jgi:hypothetical protein